MLSREHVLIAVGRLYDCMVPTPIPIDRIETKNIVAYWKDGNTLVFEVDTSDYYSNWKPVSS